MRGSIIFILILFGGTLSLSCQKISDFDTARHYSDLSDIYYHQAEQGYKRLIEKEPGNQAVKLGLAKLYYSHGELTLAIDILKSLSLPEAMKILAISYYKSGDFTLALDVFTKNSKSADDEYLYYWGLVCENLNLFDQALDIYSKVRAGEFLQLAHKRLQLIEKRSQAANIKDSDPKLYKILIQKANPDKYPQAGALILLSDEKVKIKEDNSQLEDLHYVIKIINERGKETFAEASIDYDSTFEKVELEYARTIKPDGSIVGVGSRHIRDVSKYLNFPLYSNSRVFIISFPEVSEGCILEYKVKIHSSKLINDKDFVIAYPLQAQEPIAEARFQLSTPLRLKPNITKINEQYNNFSANLNPEVTQAGNTMIYSWVFKDIPQLIPENNMPAVVDINPAILLSTFNSWQNVHEWWWNLAKDKIAADKDIKRQVRLLTKRCKSAEAKARAIYNFCAQKIRYVAVEYGQAGYEPHRAEDIYRNKYGDCKDQAVLLVAMLKEAGFDAWPVLISTKGYYNLDPGFASSMFNHCIAVLELHGKFIFLDPTAETCSFGDLPAVDQERKVLIIKPDKYQIEDTPLFDAAHNLIQQKITARINKNEGISAEKIVDTRGIYDQLQRAWLLYTPPEMILDAIKERMQDISIGAKLIDYKILNADDINKPVVLSYKFEGPEYFTQAGPLRVMPQLVSLDPSLVGKEKRKYPIEFHILDKKEMAFYIEIPYNFVIKYVPESIIEDSPWMKLQVEYRVNKNKIYARQQVELKKRIIPQEDYNKFQSFYTSVAKKIKQRIILERLR